MKYWIKPNIENRIKNGEIPGYFHSSVLEILPDSIRMATPEGELTLANDFVFAMTGIIRTWSSSMPRNHSRPRVAASAHGSRTLESERAGVYLAGVIVAGMHTNEIFIENGRFHGQLIADHVAKSIK